MFTTTYSGSWASDSKKEADEVMNVGKKKNKEDL